VRRVAGEPNVLIVDDRPDNLLALEAILDPLPCRTVRASSGEEALRYLLKEDVAVILLDVQMPGIDGYETANAIKGRDRTRSIPIIFLSAIDREIHHQLRGYSSGAVDFLPKPLNPEVLVAKVRVFLDLHRQARTIAVQAAELAKRLEERDAALEALNAATADLQRSNGDLERFALVAAHDLLEPLQIGRGLLELLEDRHAKDLGDKGAALAREAAASLDGMADLVSGLLAYAKAGSTGAVPTTQPFDLGAVFHEICHRLEAELTAAEAVLTNDPLPTVQADPHVVREVLTQVIRSALSRHDGTPHLHVGLTRRGERWVVSVSDDGPTIPPVELSRLFTLFGTADDRQTGVVLALARRLLDSIGEEIWAEASPVRGTTVSFTLPVGAGG
jgi:signal transduction histidine kinase